MAFDHYEIWRSLFPTSGFALLGKSISVSFQDTTASPLLTYYYYIVVVDTNGIRSAASAVFSSVASPVSPVIPPITPPGPSHVSLSGIISPANYVVLSDLYGLVEQQLVSRTDDFRNATQVVIESEPLVKEELYDVFFRRYLESKEEFRQNLLEAVRSLNNHVVNRSGLAGINAYLDRFGIIVSEGWADLCEEAGEPIEAQFVE